MAGPLDEVFARFATLNAALMHRSAPIIELAESAAASDPELAEHRDHAHATSRADLHALAAELKQQGALAPDISEEDATDTCTPSSPTHDLPPPHDRVRLDRARYADLLARTLKATLGKR